MQKVVETHETTLTAVPLTLIFFPLDQLALKAGVVVAEDWAVVEFVDPGPLDDRLGVVVHAVAMRATNVTARALLNVLTAQWMAQGTQ
jgi:hypothetical protein